MKVYFSAANDVDLSTKNFYKEIIKIVEKQGHKVIESLFSEVSKISLNDQSDFGDVYDSILKNIDQSDVLLADISHGSSGVGYQIYHAMYQKMPVILIYSDSKRTNPSVVMRGIKSKKVLICKYLNMGDLSVKLPEILRKATKMTKVRFNLVMRNDDYSFLEKVSKSEKISKTRFINRLILEARRLAKV